MKRLTLIFFIACFSNSLAQRTNVVLIMADDIGLGDIGFYHTQRTGEEPIIPTPNIDLLIKNGMRFNDAHSPASLCAPTRFSMLTGNFSYRNKTHPWGVWKPEIKAGIEPNFTTIARIAQSADYKTAFFGKWGLGGVWNNFNGKTEQYKKMDKGARYFGFDYAVELPQGIQNMPFAFYENSEWLPLNAKSELVELSFEQTKYDERERHHKREGLGDSYWDPTLAGFILADKAVEYIQNQKAATPFFLYYCSQAVHIPHTPSEKLDGIEVAGTTANKQGDMIKELDIQVGMIVKALKKQGLYENTLFIFTSDNGGLKHYNAKGHDSSNGLTGAKGSIYEGGHRVPFIAVWPDKIKPNTSADVTIVSHDIVATLAALLQTKSVQNKILDAANLLPVLTKESTDSLHKYILHQSQSSGGPYYALREGDWKLVMKTEKREDFENLEVIGLYNLQQDVAELPKNNLINDTKQSKRIEEMLQTYKKIRMNGEITVNQ